MRFDGMLVDLDDTVLAFDSVSEPVWVEVCDRHAPVLGCAAGELHAAIRNVARRFWSDPARHQRGRMDLLLARREIVGEALRQLRVDEAVAQHMAEEYSVARDQAIHPLPGAIETLARWRQMGLRLALVTNGAAAGQRRKIERFGLDHFFDAVFVEGECGFGKPDRRIFELALRRLAIPVARTCMVGDSLEFDIVGAQRVGIHAVWVDASGRGLPREGLVRPDAVVRSIAETGVA